MMVWRNKSRNKNLKYSRSQWSSLWTWTISLIIQYYLKVLLRIRNLLLLLISAEKILRMISWKILINWTMTNTPTQSALLSQGKLPTPNTLTTSTPSENKNFKRYELTQGALSSSINLSRSLKPSAKWAQHHAWPHNSKSSNESVYNSKISFKCPEMPLISKKLGILGSCFLKKLPVISNITLKWIWLCINNKRKKLKG